MISLAELRAAMGPLDGDDASATIRYLSWRRLVWRRFRRHPLALTGAVLLAFMILLAAIGPAIAPPPPPPLIGRLSAEQIREATFHEAPPQLSWRYLLGTDDLANPVLRNVLEAGQPPLEIGILGALLASLIGIVSGALAGFLGGWIDTIWMRTTDAFLAMPFVPLLLLASTSLDIGSGSTVSKYIVLFGLLGWPGVARLIRGYVLSMREWEYIVAARATGISEPNIVFRHILPNVLGVMIVSFTLNIGVFIGSEVTLEFLGGPPPGAESWGEQMRVGFNFLLAGDWWPVFFPALAVLLVILSVNLLGDGLRDAIDASTSDPVVERVRSEGAERRWVRSSAVRRRWRATAEFKRSVAAQWRQVSRSIRRRMAPAPAAVTHLVDSVDRGLGAGRPVSRLVSLGPIALAFLIGGTVVLAGRAPRTYAPDYAPPVSYGATLPGADYGALPRPKGGWGLFSVDGNRTLTYRQMDAHEVVRTTQSVSTGLSSGAEPTMAAGGGQTLGVWLAEGRTETTLRASYLGDNARAVPFNLLTGGTLQHPFVFALPHGGFEILVGRLRGAASDLYLASIPPGATHPSWVRLLVKASDYAYLPRAVIDGSGNLVVVYLDRCCNGGLWNIQVARFSPSGRPVSRVHTLAQISKLTPTSSPVPAHIPETWGLGVLRVADGSVWTVAQGDVRLFAAHWSANGKELLPPRPLCGSTGCLDAHGSLALASSGSRKFLFATTTSLGVGQHLYGASFNDAGIATPPERIAYDYGGGADNVQAASSGGTVSLIWQKSLYGSGTIFEGSAHYPTSHAPDLTARLAINIGPTWAVVAILVVGSLVAGVPLATVNAFLLTLLLLLWAIISRLVRGSARWPLYVLVVLCALLLVFGRSTSTPSFVFILTSWGAPLGWVLALGATLVAAWIGYFPLRHMDDPFRATGMAIFALYFIAVMTALSGIQTELAQI